MNDKEALIADLHDIEIPSVPNAIAPGWFLVLFVLLLLVLAAVLWFRRRSALAWQRQAEQELDSIRFEASKKDSQIVISRSSALARRVVLAVEARSHVSALNGEPWLQQLDSICGQPAFTQGPGRLLLDYPYRKNTKVPDADLNDLLDSVGLLIKSAGRYKSTRSTA